MKRSCLRGRQDRIAPQICDASKQGVVCHIGLVVFVPDRDEPETRKVHDLFSDEWSLVMLRFCQFWMALGKPTCGAFLLGLRSDAIENKIRT
jgi:hypothetical protein